MLLDGVEPGDHLELAAAHIGMSKSGLYAHFGSKQELQLVTVETAQEIFEKEVVEPTDAMSDPLERLRALCDGFLSYVERGVFPGGCLFASSAAEFDTHPGPVKDKIASFQHDWIERIELLVREAQAAGTLDATEDPAQLAFELYAYLLLGNAAFVLHDDPTQLQHARTAITGRLSRAR